LRGAVTGALPSHRRFTPTTRVSDTRPSLSTHLLPLGRSLYLAFRVSNVCLLWSIEREREAPDQGGVLLIHYPFWRASSITCAAFGSFWEMATNMIPEVSLNCRADKISTFCIFSSICKNCRLYVQKIEKWHFIQKKAQIGSVFRSERKPPSRSLAVVSLRIRAI
jgi:hypothetical protein